MSVGMLSSQQLRSMVEDKWQRDLDAVAVGLHITPSWHSPSEVEFEFGKAEVVRADTVFEIREALRSAEKNSDRIVLLTGLQQADLGHDVVGRLARSRLFTVDHWATLCTLFKAKQLDRSICEPAIARALIEYAPPDGYPPVSAGVLDAGTVWRAICRHVFDMGEREPDLVSLLLWSASDNGMRCYQKAAADIRTSLRDRLTRNLGEPAASVLRFMDSGAGQDTLALAVVCQVVYGQGDDQTLDAAAARMEKYHDNTPMTKAVGQALGRAVVDAIADLDRQDDPRIAQQHLQRADNLLEQFFCEDHAYRNTLSRRGFQQRLQRLGGAIAAAVNNLTKDTKETTESCEFHLSEVLEHRLAKLGRNRSQVSTAEMAVRLVRWLNNPSDVPSSFEEQADQYVRELSFVDWAREPLCRGEDVAELSTAYQLLDQTVLERRADLNRTFAKSLADWSAVGSSDSGVLGVEDVLGQVVSRVVQADNRVLLVVLDGMSWAVCHELLQDIRQDHWFEVTLNDSCLPPAPVIATMPSITTYSRTSLLSGTLTKGDQNLEKHNFESNRGLLEVSDKRCPPRLFHKKDITEGNRGAISQPLSNSVLSTQQRVVGVVINAIDDRLNNAQQVIDHWSVDRISPLRTLLRLARDSGRVVILASDHGHVWHRPDSEHRPHEEGSRWRTDDGTCADDEIVLTGDRVMGTDNGVIMPWSERVYYGHQQNGYHGGASCQEMICPLVMLVDKSSGYCGLFQCEYPKPDWWSAAPVASAEITQPPVKVTVPKQAGPPTLFDMEPEEEEPEEPARQPEAASSRGDWISELLGSDAYRHQKSMIRRHRVEDEDLRTALKALDNSGGIMTPAAFSKAVNVAPARVDGLVAKMQRVLNVDGYEILNLDRHENRVELNVPKLKRQFDLN
ncbi:MAG: BREX-2 system phosphatase PglZ [Planctomycetota bacterium]